MRGKLKISKVLLIAGAVWLVVWDIGSAGSTANPLTVFTPGMSQIDNLMPGSKNFPNLLPPTAFYLLTAGAIGHFTKAF